jgi:hypothetical protein
MLVGLGLWMKVRAKVPLRAILVLSLPCELYIDGKSRNVPWPELDVTMAVAVESLGEVQQLYILPQERGNRRAMSMCYARLSTHCLARLAWRPSVPMGDHVGVSRGTDAGGIDDRRAQARAQHSGREKPCRRVCWAVQRDS